MANLRDAFFDALYIPQVVEWITQAINRVTGRKNA